MSRYVAEFRVENLEQEQDTKSQPTNEVLSKERKFDSKVIGKTLTTGVAVTMLASRLYAQQVATSNSIVGNSVAQRQFDNKMAYLNEGLQVFGTVGIAAIINPVAAVGAAGALAVSYGLRSYQVSQQNQVRGARLQVENIVNQQKQSRLVKDITGIRI
jgi:hypothetical protein